MLYMKVYNQFLVVFCFITLKRFMEVLNEALVDLYVD